MLIFGSLGLVLVLLDSGVCNRRGSWAGRELYRSSSAIRSQHFREHTGLWSPRFGHRSWSLVACLLFGTPFALKCVLCSSGLQRCAFHWPKIIHVNNVYSAYHSVVSRTVKKTEFLSNFRCKLLFLSRFVLRLLASVQTGGIVLLSWTWYGFVCPIFILQVIWLLLRH